MLKTISIWRRQRAVIEIAAAPTDSNIDERRAAHQLAAEIRAQGSAIDMAAQCARAANTRLPERPEEPVEAWM